MPATDYLRGKLYDHIFRNMAYSPLANVYLEWCKDTTVPTSAVAGTPSGVGRSVLPMNDDGGDGIGDNSAQVSVSGLPAGNYPYIEIWDASTAGNRLFFATASSVLSFAAPGIAYVDVGALIATVMGTSGTDYLRNKIYDLIFRNTAYTPPTTVYLELCTNGSAPTSATAGTPSGVGRVATAMADDAGGLGSGLNSGTVTFSAVAIATYSYAEFWDASTVGNRLTFAALASNIVMGATGDVLFNPGTITATIT